MKNSEIIELHSRIMTLGNLKGVKFSMLIAKNYFRLKSEELYECDKHGWPTGKTVLRARFQDNNKYSPFFHGVENE